MQSNNTVSKVAVLNDVNSMVSIMSGNGWFRNYKTSMTSPMQCPSPNHIS